MNAGYGRQTGTNPIVNDQGYPLEGEYNATSAQFTGGAEFVILSATGERIGPLLAMIALSSVQSSAQTFFHNAIFFIDSSNSV